MDADFRTFLDGSYPGEGSSGMCETSGNSSVAISEPLLDLTSMSQQLVTPNETLHTTRSRMSPGHVPEDLGLFSPWSQLIAAFRLTPDPSRQDVNRLSTQLKIKERRVYRLFEDANDLSKSVHAGSRYPYEILTFFSPCSILMSTFKQKLQPCQSEIVDLSGKLKINSHIICRLLEDAREICSFSPAAPIGLITPEATRSLLSSNSALEPNPNKEVVSSSTHHVYPSKKRRRRGASPGTTSSLINEPRKQVRRRFRADDKEGKYPCLSCTPETPKSKTMDEWYAHQKRNHFPTEVFSCGLLIKKNLCKYGYKPMKRRDNFKSHLRTHLRSDDIDAFDDIEEEISKRTLQVEGLFHDKCGFCSRPLSSWQQSMEHIGAHIERGAQINEWEHKCSSLEHEMLPNVHYMLPITDRGTEEHDSDEEDTDQEDFGGGGGDGPSGQQDFGNFGDENNFDFAGSDVGGGGNSSGGGGPFSHSDYNEPYWTFSHSHMKNLLLAAPIGGSEQSSKLLRPFEALSIVRHLGAGAYGRVSEVMNVKTWKTCVLKTIQRKKLHADDSQDLMAFKDEVRILRKLKLLRNPHLVSFEGCLIGANRFLIFMQPVGDFDLEHYLATFHLEDERMEYSPIDAPLKVLERGIASLASAVRDIHAIGICHCDIKPSNILVKNDDFLLTDFGISTDQIFGNAHNNENIKMTPHFAAPETAKGSSSRYAADVWSLGCVLAEVVTYLGGKTLSEFQRFRLYKLSSDEINLDFNTSKGQFKKHRATDVKHHFGRIESPQPNRPYWETLDRMHEWLRLLDENKINCKCSDQTHSSPFDTIRKMLSENPVDRPTSHEVWLQFWHCSCYAISDKIHNHPPIKPPAVKRGLLRSRIRWAMNQNNQKSLDKSPISKNLMLRPTFRMLDRVSIAASVVETMSHGSLKTILNQESQILIKDLVRSAKESEELVLWVRDEYEKVDSESETEISIATRGAERHGVYSFQETPLPQINSNDHETFATLSSTLSVLSLEDHQKTQYIHSNCNKVSKVGGNSKIPLNLRHWLKAPDSTIDHNTACVKGYAAIGRWITESPSFKRWLASENSVFSITGKPGSGKTTLCSKVIQTLSHRFTSHIQVGLAYFYFKFNDQSKQDTSAMLRTLLLQLSNQLQDNHEELTQLHASIKPRMPSAMLLIGSLRRIVERFQHVYIFIDALDEVSSDDLRAHVLDTIKLIHGWNFRGLHLFSTSREHRDVRELFDRLSAHEFKMENPETNRDIFNFILQRLDSDSRLLEWRKDRDKIAERLTEKANGIFLWVDLQLTSLETWPRSTDNLNFFLKSLPSSLEETYERSLCRIKQNTVKDAQRLLLWLCFASRPLTLCELVDVIAFDTNGPASLYKDFRLESYSDIRDMCGDLIDVNIPPDEGILTVQLVHFTAKEYLTSVYIKCETASKFCMVTETAHAEIARTSLIYLLHCGCSKTDLDGNFLEIYPLAQYAATYWYSHYLNIANLPSDLDTWISKLFQQKNPFVTWVRLHDLDRPWETSVVSGRTMQEFASPLYYASLLGLSRTLDVLLDTKVQEDTNAQNGRCGTALQAASLRGHKSIVEILLKRGAHVDARCGKYGTALQAASSKGHEKVVRLLLEHGACVDAWGGKYGTALRAASSKRHEKVMRLLLEHGAHVDIRGRKHGLPLWAASSKGQNNMF